MLSTPVFPKQIISLSKKIQTLNLQLLTERNFNPESFYTSILDKLTSKNQLNQIHSQIIISGFQCNGFIITKFIHVSSNLSDISYARKVFDKFPDPYVFLWNAIIRGYSKHNMFNEAIKLYTLMQNMGVAPDCFTMPHVLKSCGGIAAFEAGRAVHAHIFRRGFEADVFVQNGLVAVYAKCGKIHNARVVFEGLNDRTIVSWTSMISAYAQNGYPIEALTVFKKMRSNGLQPDFVALVSVISAYTDIEDLQQGRSFHSFVIKTGLELEPDLRITLTTMYAKCRQVAVAKLLFDEMETDNVIMWNTMISGFAKNGFCNEAIALFQQMLSKNLTPDSITVSSTILACAHLGSLEKARKIGEYIDNSHNSEYKFDVFVNTALIDMYAKCGSVELARKVFDQMKTKDIVVWSAMIAGYGLHGKAHEAINLFNSMKKSRVLPNDVTFIGLLKACAHAGFVEEGWKIFSSMEKTYGIKPRYEHYAIVVDLLGRAGCLDWAYEFVKNMPMKPGVTIWGAVLSASTIYRHVGLGEYAARELFALDPYNTGHYVQLSNLYASVYMWSGVAYVRVLMNEKGLIKDMGSSMIEIKGNS